MMKRVFSLLLGCALLLSFAGCAAPDTAQTSFTAGTYEANAPGHNGPLTVSVTVSDHAIESVAVTKHSETPNVGDIAIERVSASIVEQQSLAVDTVTGATITSNAVMRAAVNALTTAGMNVSALTAKAATAPLKAGAAETVDVVVVGSGLSGFYAAYELKNKFPDIKYVVLEKQGIAFGATPFAGTDMTAPTSKMHKANNAESTMEEFYKAMAGASGIPVSQVNRAFVDKVYEARQTEPLLNEFIDGGVPFKEVLGVSAPAYSDKVRYIDPVDESVHVTRFLYKKLEADPINLRFNSRVTDLIITNGTVTGVKVRDKEKEYEIHAKAVILATGGFAGSKEMMQKYEPLYVDGLDRSVGYATGDGFAMVEKAGGQIVGSGLMASNRPVTNDGRKLLNPGTVGNAKFIVSTDGVRIVGEHESIYAICAATAETRGAGKRVYYVVDANNYNPADIKARMDAGLGGLYNTLEEAAQKLNINQAALLKTAADYNAAVNAGRSPGFDLPVNAAAKVEKGPFYFEEEAPSYWGTLSGADIDDNFRALNKDSGAPIPGLYVAGEMSANHASSREYVGFGFLVVFSMSSGQLAARSAVADLQR